MQFFKGMVEGGKNGGEVFGNGFAAAGEGNDDGASERPGDGAGVVSRGASPVPPLVRMRSYP